MSNLDFSSFFVALLSFILGAGGAAMNKEVREMFPTHSSKPSSSSCTPGSNLLARCDDLLQKLRSDPSNSLARRLKRVKKRAPRSGSKRVRNEDPVTKRLVVLNFPGNEVEEIMPVFENDVLVDGFFTVEHFDDECDVRGAIVELVKKKQRDNHDFRGVTADDMEFVRVVNKKVRVPDGEVSYDAQGLCKVYPHGAVYVRLTKDFEVRIHF